jgi:hypothetical protein
MKMTESLVAFLGVFALQSVQGAETRFLELAPRDVEQYSELWTEPLFAQPLAIEAPPVQTEESPVDLVLTGWGEIHGKWVASIYDRRSGMYHFLHTGESSQSCALELVELQLSAMETKALVQVNERLLWITPDADPAPTMVVAQEADEVDSRAAMMTGAQLLTADATTAGELCREDSVKARLADRLHQKALLERHRALSQRFASSFDKLTRTPSRFAD